MFIRRKCAHKGKGYGKDILFTGGKGFRDQSMRTIYDIDFSPQLSLYPEISNRQWDSKDMKWAPEKVDIPINGEPREWGLCSDLHERKKENLPLAWQTSYSTTYKDSYTLSA
ncbi:hypothetical protein Ciccas_000873 [Cichlidogyrus casuarinus]|uniref:Uncharacterized protein n=1 Tax=Cichlidogyrus casuarinus TaxID=1844966 RepID=A0ABD2QLP8_9PLAT